MSKILNSWLGFILMLSGCGEVTTNQPLGLAVWSEMQGIWKVTIEDTEYFHVWLTRDGELHLARIDWSNENKQFELERGKMIVSTNDDAMYVNIQFPSESEQEGEFTFYRAVMSPGRIVTLFAPKKEVFAQAIEDGVLKGKVTRRKFDMDEVLTTDPVGLEKFVKADKFSEQFDLDSPLSLYPVSDFLGPMKGPTVMFQAKKDHTACLPEDLAERVRKGSPLEGVVRTILSGAGKEDVDKAWEQFGEESSESHRTYSAENDLVTMAELTETEFASYQNCMKERGYELLDQYSKENLWIAKNRLGVFRFEVRVDEPSQEVTTESHTHEKENESEK